MRIFERESLFLGGANKIFAEHLLGIKEFYERAFTLTIRVKMKKLNDRLFSFFFYF